MSASPIDGFITKKEIAERYTRSHRSLTRDFSKAVRTRETSVLSHLKLRTEDGVVRKGTDEEVTLELIQDLSNNGLTPTWYVEQTWAERKYGEQPDVGTIPTHDPQPLPTDAGTEPQASTGMVARLERHIEELKQDKQGLREELKIKNEQITQANERTRESNSLMKELQKQLSNWQEQAFKTLPMPRPPAETSRDDESNKTTLAATVPETSKKDAAKSGHTDLPVKKAKIQESKMESATAQQGSDKPKKRLTPAKRPTPPKKPTQRKPVKKTSKPVSRSKPDKQLQQPRKNLPAKKQLPKEKPKGWIQRLFG